jgi:hypothetical protein
MKKLFVAALVFLMCISIVASIHAGGKKGGKKGGGKSSEKVASKIEDLVGIYEALWRGEPAYRQFFADGTQVRASTIEELKDASKNTKVWFEGEVFVMDNTENPGIGKYEVKIQKKGKTTKLLFTIIEEPKSNRGVDFTAGMTRVEP